MKHLNTPVLVVWSAMALLAFAPGIATATTLEVGGTAKTEQVELTGTLKAGTSMTFKTTAGLFLNRCGSSHLQAATASPFTDTKVTGPLALGVGLCEEFIAGTGGSLYIEHISGTTNGTVFWENAEWKISTVVGQLNCKMGAGTDIGTLTGVASGHATLDVNAILNCPFLPSVRWEATYTITSPTGLGIVS